ncbi:prepilin-type N-terminal cleavage/methylation domain-containing protein [Burkholderia sp. FERM BP-3421]|jgi:type IV pilus assembly protein PilE|uniref:type IV pilin protein n=1 Tax=Burkholderia sp. FERM BP-3421 TaxID=1494466 RepID=UPI00235EACE4|nr:type IV pilin protein [Burkholderia sp. FERM BP-3421]WDD96479.1 prepilin-type N-terminal cleavage/methylation domain-containing protein [Burkholderia sp. FERM BP-3421]
MRVVVSRSPARLRRGVSLVELMIVLAVAAVLAAFAVPSYRHHIARGHRFDAMAALYRAAHHVEMLETGLPARLPDGFDRVPAHGRAVYELVLRAPESGTGSYTLEARPSPGGAMRDDACGIYVLHADGVRENRAAGDPSVMPDGCWSTR